MLPTLFIAGGTVLVLLVVWFLTRVDDTPNPLVVQPKPGIELEKPKPVDPSAGLWKPATNYEYTQPLNDDDDLSLLGAIIGAEVIEELVDSSSDSLDDSDGWGSDDSDSW